MGANPKTYEGKEPYIFISYSHKESDIIIPIIERLQADGYRVWYDDGIIPGTEWPETIAQHLNDSSVFICFISPSYVDSFNCKRELDFAVHKRKDFLAVFLEETKMPLGMEMQVSSVQAMFYYKTTPDEFFKMMYESGLIEACKAGEGEASVGDDEASGDGAGEAKADATDQPKDSSEGVGAAGRMAEGQELEKALETAAKEAAKEPAKAEKKGKSGKSKVGLIVGLVAGVVLAVILLAGVIGVIFLAAPKNPYKDQAVVELFDETIDDKTLKQILSDESLMTLHLENCHFQIADQSIWAAKMPENVEALELINCNLTDYDMSMICAAVSPSKIDISYNPGVAGTDFLTMCSGNLRELNINHTGINDLSMLPRTEIEVLYAESNGISDISALSGMTSLSELYVANNLITEVPKDTDWNSLRILDISGNDLGDLNFLKSAIHLEVIKADDNNILNIRGLENCTLLQTVSLVNNSVTSVAPLEGSKDSIRFLILSDNNVSKIDYSLPALEWLVIDNNNFRYLGFLTESQGLEYVSAARNRLDSIYEIQDKPYLKYLNVSHNSIEGEVDISALSSLEKCFLDHNEFTTINVKGAEFLALNGNRNLESITGADATFLLRASSSYNAKHEDLLNSPFCREIYVQDVPLDKQVAYEMIWGDSIIFTDEEGMQEIIDSEIN